MTFPLVQKVAAPKAIGREGVMARAELARIGARAVKPLLDALADEKESQQKNRDRGARLRGEQGRRPALHNFAVGTAEKACASAR